MAVIVADTGAILALLDSGDRHHAAVREIYEDRPDVWVLPWAILPEVDYLVASELGARTQEAFAGDLAEGAFVVEFGRDADLARAHAIGRKYRSLNLGLVDTIVMATAERLRADAIATLDLRHFGAVRIAGSPRLLPRDA
ncbi:MAG TPA: PIN domain-containing protein [Vicinamibacterales bacterium]|nr:PIN domain-containing protein [Vicinamibacterales bacterium]